MTPSNLLNGINNLATYLLENGIAFGYQAAVMTKFGNFAEISSAYHTNITLGEYCTAREYLDQLRSGNYFVTLIDGSLVQLYYLLEREIVKKNRLCYYPCPVKFDHTESDGNESLFDTVEEMITTGSPIDIRLQSSVRFEYDTDSVSTNHPAAHLHLNYAEARIPVYGPVSAGHFIKFIIRHFYPKIWQANQPIRDWPVDFWDRTMTNDDRYGLHIECLRNL